ncbi:MAG: DMT family transporter [Brachymonas sp.]|nr:DMT family transporter [Brachymonas sp.]
MTGDVQPKRTASVLPVLAIALNAVLWGITWIPMHQLRDRGVHALWATFLSYALAVGLVLLWRPGALAQVARDKKLWLLMCTSGFTNSSFNWAISTGDVVRVVLLLYLMPVWSVLLTWVAFGEKPSPFTLLRVAIAVVGVMLVLQPPGNAWHDLVLPVPRSLSDGLALASGMVFAGSNVLLNRLGSRPAAAKVLAMFSGCALLSGVLAVSMMALGLAGVVAPPPLQASWLVFIALVIVQLLVCNFCLQYGAPHMSAHMLALLMSLEVLVAAASSSLLGAGALSGSAIVGGVLVVGAALLEAFDHLGKSRHAVTASESALP